MIKETWKNVPITKDTVSSQKSQLGDILVRYMGKM